MAKGHERNTSKHAGGKLIELGAASLTDSELLSIIIGAGIPGRSALSIAEEVIERFGSLEGLCNQPLERLLAIRGLHDVKIVRIAAAYEIALRLNSPRRKGKA